ncbi:hypothetical protein AVI51_11285 [Piscirickettsia salmonis]|uniref:Uncharacterized protein n=1 Tax=Piscirickettsia salmonis TaxID=1238 RepID=A0A9Q5VMY7_PISSA|nr:hypothetical protein [Piscirickettsia salmonis]ALA26404.1 hypothetical protein KW89_2945 [Piscirickettsia salmonis]APS43830.1 hypothetical protein AVI48_05215 [Piscirickettsia salmonis]APS47184.1 hypothetical protein AVI49_05815 [Piscirickettsia salmonis]APS51375.1 hypothetical protein AVI50_11400 [Piscirickettsia salmonis]APS54585.1 hypothetical protein AVI51_11285 [Piscirickettsia salmonis]
MKSILSYLKCKFSLLFLVFKKEESSLINLVDDNAVNTPLLEKVNYFYDDSEDLYQYEVTNLHI